MLPLGFYHARADDQSNYTRAGDDNQTNSDDHSDHQVERGDNQTGTENGTASQYNATVSSGIGLEISNFVHNATALFQQQRNETLQAIKDCRQQLNGTAPENRTQIVDQCHSTLAAIKEKYQAARQQFDLLFRQFRESMMTLRDDAEGMHVSEKERVQAMKNIDDDARKHNMTRIDDGFEKMRGVGEKDMMGIGHVPRQENDTFGYNGTGKRWENYNESSYHRAPVQHGEDSRGQGMRHDYGGFEGNH